MKRVTDESLLKDESLQRIQLWLMEKTLDHECRCLYTKYIWDARSVVSIWSDVTMNYADISPGDAGALLNRSATQR